MRQGRVIVKRITRKIRPICPKSSKVVFARRLSSGVVLRDGKIGFSTCHVNSAGFIKPVILALVLTNMTHICIFKNYPKRVIFVN